MESTTLVWVITGVVVLVGVMVLLSTLIKRGKKLEVPPAHMQSYDQVLDEQRDAEKQ